jgi:teichuronic acid exporter
MKHLISLIASVILARFLSPSDYGNFAAVLFFVSMISVISDIGLKFFIQRSEKNKKIQVSSIFWLNVSIALLITFFLNIISQYVGIFFNVPVFENMFLYISLVNLLTITTNVPLSLLIKEFKIETILLAEIVFSFGASIIAIYLAYHGNQYWALISQYSITEILMFTFIWYKSKWRPSFSFNFSQIIPALNFSKFLFLSQVIDVIYSKAYVYILSMSLSTAQLGFFNRAESLSNYPGGILSSFITKLIYPLAARLNNEKKDIVLHVKNLIFICGILNYFIIFSFIILSNSILDLLYGNNWLPILQCLKILSLSLIFYPINIILTQSTSSAGYSKNFFHAELIKKICGVFSLFICFSIDKSINGLAFGYLLASFFGTIINVFLFSISHKTSSKFIFLEFIPSFLSSFFVYILSLQFQLSIFKDNYIFGEITTLSIFCLTYLLLIFIFSRNRIRFILNAYKS